MNRRPPRSTLFPTRRSSDLVVRLTGVADLAGHRGEVDDAPRLLFPQDRKSTRLNSSHVSSSYAVSCLKKKTGQDVEYPHRRPTENRLTQHRQRTGTAYRYTR